MPWILAYHGLLLHLLHQSTKQKSQEIFITILFHMLPPLHIMRYTLTKEEKQMAFGNENCGCEEHGRGISSGIAAIVVIILLLIAMGIVF